MLWFLRGIRRGVVTTRYPRETDAWARQLPSPPAFRSELLTAELADELARECPPGALRVEGDSLILDLGACTACGRCLAVAGEAAVASGEFELAGRARETLRKRIPIGAAR